MNVFPPIAQAEVSLLHTRLDAVQIGRRFVVFALPSVCLIFIFYLNLLMTKWRYLAMDVVFRKMLSFAIHLVYSSKKILKNDNSVLNILTVLCQC